MAEHRDTLHLRWRQPAQVCGALLAVALLAGSTAPATPTASSAPKTHTITIENMRFDPAELTVKRGDRVVWVNKDMFPHTATAAAKAFDSGDIAANGSWSYVASTTGDYAYVCTFHPTMKGRLSVQ